MNYMMISPCGGVGSCLELPALCLNSELPSDFGPRMSQQSIAVCLWSAWHKQGLSSFLLCTPLPVEHHVWSQEVMSCFWSGQAVTDVCAGSGQPRAPIDGSFCTPTPQLTQSPVNQPRLDAHRKLLLGASGTGTWNGVTVLRKVCLLPHEKLWHLSHAWLLEMGIKRENIYRFSLK